MTYIGVTERAGFHNSPVLQIGSPPKKCSWVLHRIVLFFFFFFFFFFREDAKGDGGDLACEFLDPL